MLLGEYAVLDGGLSLVAAAGRYAQCAFRGEGVEPKILEIAAPASPTRSPGRASPAPPITRWPLSKGSWIGGLIPLRGATPPTAAIYTAKSQAVRGPSSWALAAAPP